MEKQFLILFWHFEMGNTNKMFRFMKMVFWNRPIADILFTLEMDPSYEKILYDTYLYESVLNFYRKDNITVLTFLDLDYPEQVMEMTNPPLVLAVKGDYKLLCQQPKTLIGEDELSTYCHYCVDRVIDHYCNHPFVLSILFDFSKEICDCYKTKSFKPIVVLASGFHQFYPMKHLFLEKYVEKIGAVVTEYPLKHAFHKYELPRHRELLAGLGKQTVCISAKAHSPVLLTAFFTVEQNKDVIVPPANLNETLHCGTNLLLEEGALLLTNEWDDLVK